RQLNPRQCGYTGQARGDSSEQEQQQAVTTEPVGQQTTDGPQETAEEHHDGSQITGGDGRQTVLIVEEDGQITCQADETAKGQAIDKAKPGGIRLFEQSSIIAPALHSPCSGSVFSH